MNLRKLSTTSVFICGCILSIATSPSEIEVGDRAKLEFFQKFKIKSDEPGKAFSATSTYKNSAAIPSENLCSARLNVSCDGGDVTKIVHIWSLAEPWDGTWPLQADVPSLEIALAELDQPEDTFSSTETGAANDTAENNSAPMDWFDHSVPNVDVTMNRELHENNYGTDSFYISLDRLDVPCSGQPFNFLIYIDAQSDFTLECTGDVWIGTGQWETSGPLDCGNGDSPNKVNVDRL